jgi:excisionase family DNA binding protein
MNIQETLNSVEAAKYLSLSRQTLANWRHNGKGPDYVRLGRAIRYRNCDLNEFIEKNRVQVETK